MFASFGARLVCAAALMVGTVAVQATPAAADEPDFEVDFPAGLVCDFELHVAAFDVVVDPTKVFTDKNGNVVEKVWSGKGYDLVFTSPSTETSFSTKANGSNNWTITHPDGTVTTILTGHNIVFMFPTDVPAGPSTMLYVGRVVLEIDTDAVYTMSHLTGKQIDICAALSG